MDDSMYVQQVHNMQNTTAYTSNKYSIPGLAAVYN